MNTKPTSISAAEFVAGDYAAKIAAGECKVWDGGRDRIEVRTILKSFHRKDGVYIVDWVDEEGIRGIGIDNWRDAIAGDTFEVEWLNQDAASRQLEIHQQLKAEIDAGLEFMPNEDIEQYTDAIAALRAEVERLRAANTDLWAFYEMMVNLDLQSEAEYQLADQDGANIIPNEESLHFKALVQSIEQVRLVPMPQLTHLLPPDQVAGAK